MTLELIVSNSPWNDKTHAPTVESWDPIDVHVRFDQPIAHALEYIDQDVTQFWIDVSTAGTPISTLRANKVLAEINDEARTFKNGRFKFALCKLPDALSQHYHAAFAATMAALPPGTHPVTLTFWTDNGLQKSGPLATLTFDFVLAEGSADHLRQVAAVNLEHGADQVDDPVAKAAAFERIRQSRLASASSSAAAGTVRVRLTAKDGDVRVRLHTGPGASLPTTVHKKVTSDWHVVQVGSSIELLGAGDSTLRSLATVNAGMDGTTLSVG